MPGRIVRRGDRFCLVIYAGRDGGKRKDRWLSFKTYGEAEAAQRELASHVLAHSAGVGLYGVPRERLGTYLRDWLARQQARLERSTWERYETITRQIQADPLGAIRLGRITPRALEGYYARAAARGLSPTTVQHHHRLLHKAFRDAVRQDLILQNPADAALAPRRARPRLEIWTEAQTLLFLSEAKARSPYDALYLFLVSTGCRLGEALGLCWRDVSFGEGVVSVMHALERPRGGGYVLKDPKTVHSRRSVAIPPEVVGVLRDLKARQEQAARASCPDGTGCRRRRCPYWHPLDLVFCQPNGLPLHANNVRERDLHPLCQRLGLPWKRALHNIRHAHGSYLLQRGVSVKVVQERLGHGTPAFTLATYAHVLQGMQTVAAQAVSALLGGV